MNIGENIRKFRKAKGMKQNELAELISTPVSTLANYESGRRTPSLTGVAIGRYENGSREPQLSTIEAIAQALDVTVPELLGYESHEGPEIFMINDITQFTTDELLKEVFRRVKE